MSVPVQSLIDHIKTATDVDPWAKEMAEKLLTKKKEKIFICRTSELHGEQREFESLDDCIRTLMKETENEEYIVYTSGKYWKMDEDKGCEWDVEIYDDYRE